jgi:hypothetical protein
MPEQESVVASFLNQRSSPKNSIALFTDGTHLDSYGVPIAWRSPDGRIHLQPNTAILTESMQRIAYRNVSEAIQNA